MGKRQINLVRVGIFILMIGFIVACNTQEAEFQTLTFKECENQGGIAWRVDLNHPDICPACAEYQACYEEYNDYRDICPECYGPCQECQEKYSLFESCPECYGACQACQNEYRNDFESEAERYQLCPECQVCDRCREEINAKIKACPPCQSCNECKEENKKYSDISDVCPQVVPCAECQEKKSPYPEQCPDERKKIGEISDAAIWFQCCK